MECRNEFSVQYNPRSFNNLIEIEAEIIPIRNNEQQVIISTASSTDMRRETLQRVNLSNFLLIFLLLRCVIYNFYGFLIFYTVFFVVQNSRLANKQNGNYSGRMHVFYMHIYFNTSRFHSVIKMYLIFTNQIII